MVPSFVRGLLSAPGQNPQPVSGAPTSGALGDDDEDPSKRSQIIQICVGESHGMMLTDEGCVYTWGGSNAQGQLGRKTDGNPKIEQKPAYLQDAQMKDKTIVQIACGKNHCLAISETGLLLAWGANRAGQIGITDKPVLKSLAPERVPKSILPFTGVGDGPIAKSCSCGPESSACVTTSGDVYVWGAVGFYILGDHRSENYMRPVKLTNMPNLGGDWSLAGCAVYQTSLAFTVAAPNLKDELDRSMTALRARSQTLMHQSQETKQTDLDPGASPIDEGDEIFKGREELLELDREFKDKAKVLTKKIDQKTEEVKYLEEQIAGIDRKVTICDQQDTAFADDAHSLETRKGGSAAPVRAVDTQLKDLHHFKESNKREKMMLLGQRDKLEQRNWEVKQDATQLIQSRTSIESRKRLLRSLVRGDLGREQHSVLAEGIKIAHKKLQEIRASDPQTLAGRGNFSGLKEVLSVSDRALTDVSSALKEVSAVAGGGDGHTLECVLEKNLKLRKELNELISSLLSSHLDVEDAKGASDENGMRALFDEARMLQKSKKKHHGSLNGSSM